MNHKVSLYAGTTHIDLFQWFYTRTLSLLRNSEISVVINDLLRDFVRFLTRIPDESIYVV